MTIRTKEPEVPDEFPPARLFLDDIEEIVRILADATENRKVQPRPGEEFLGKLGAAAESPNEKGRSPDGEARTRVTLTIKDQVCDEVQELPKIAKKTTDLSVDVETKKWTLATATLRFRREGSHLACIRLTDEERLSLFHKLAPVFRRRNLWLRTLVWSHYLFFFGCFFTSSLVLIAAPFILIFRHPVHPTRTILTALFLAPIIITLWTTLSRHTIIIMRHSSEPSPLRQELLQKAPLAAISSILTFLLTLLGFYLKHKYWP